MTRQEFEALVEKHKEGSFFINIGSTGLNLEVFCTDKGDPGIFIKNGYYIGNIQPINRSDFRIYSYMSGIEMTGKGKYSDIEEVQS